MESIWIQYSDEATTEPCGWSPWEQATETWPHEKQVSVSSSEYAAYYNAQMDWVKTYMPSPTAA